MRQPSGLQLGTVLQKLVATVDWRAQVRYDVDDRWYGRLDAGEFTDGVQVEAWLLTWWPGQRTGLHDHGGSAGAFAVVRGQLREDTVQTPRHALPRLHSRTLHASQQRVFGPRHLHEVVNDGAEPAVSIHVYAPRLTMMTRYRWTDYGPEVAVVEKAGADW
ncbi:cysteine dioxygenase [Cryptosporangium sp. NPDC048952]|uniref:cysteine dioxygenase n=1 Tax=Cryptosporangium sp. NPDC048952 TaxID=3363961 RepID=UPI00371EE997